MKRFALALLLALAAGVASNPAAAQTAAPLSTAQKLALRYPQPVRVGDVLGRRVLAPYESQPVLGHVVAIRKGTNGALEMIMRQSSLFGSGAVVAISLDDVALMGEHVALPDYDEAHPAIFKPATDAAAGALGADEVIKMSLTKPFH